MATEQDTNAEVEQTDVQDAAQEQVESSVPDAVTSNQDDEEIPEALAELAEETERLNTEDEQVTEPDDEVQTEQAEDDATDTEAQPEPDKQGLAKKLERMNYEQRNLFKKVDTLTASLEKALSKIEAQGGQATAKQAEQVQQVKDELDALVEGDDDDFLTRGQARQLVARIRAAEKLADEAAKKYVEPVNAAIERQQAELARQRDQIIREQFAAKNPELVSQYQQLIRTAQERLVDVPPEERKGTLWTKHATAVWNEVVSEARAKVQSTAKAPTMTPAASPKNTPGASIARSSAAAGRPRKPEDQQARLERLALELDEAASPE